MKRFNITIFFAVVLLAAAAVMLFGCMDRDVGADAGGAGAPGTDGSGTTSQGIETTSHTAANVGGTDGGGVDPLPAETGDGSGEGSDEDGGMPVLTDDLKKSIAERYKRFFSIDGVTVGGCFGEFNGAYAVMIYERGKVYTQAKWSETVDGVRFSYNDGNRILVYDGETFLTLGEAFDKGVLTHDDLVEIASRRQLDPSVGGGTEER